MFDNLAIAINVHREAPSQLMACLQRVQRNLPGAQVNVFGNDSEDGLDLICQEFGFAFVEGLNLGNNDLWYLWWRRMLDWFVSTDRDVLLKIDPDTMVDRRPRFFPEADYFGCIDDWFVQGGCTGISRRLARRLLDENALAKGRACQVHVTHKAFADDKYIGRVISDMDIAPYSWTEVYSRWREPVLNEDCRFAIVHPRYYDNG